MPRTLILPIFCFPIWIALIFSKIFGKFRIQITPKNTKFVYEEYKKHRTPLFSPSFSLQASYSYPNQLPTLVIYRVATYFASPLFCENNKQNPETHKLSQRDVTVIWLVELSKQEIPWPQISKNYLKKQ